MNRIVIVKNTFSKKIHIKTQVMFLRSSNEVIRFINR